MAYSPLRCTVLVLVLMGTTGLATLHRHEPVVLVLCIVAAVVWLILLLGMLQRLERASRQPALEVPVGLPVDTKALADRCLYLETLLEHAPVALFQAGTGTALLPLNNFSRRLLAPGWISDVADFAGKLELAGQSVGKLLEFDTERGRERALVATNHLRTGTDALRLIAVAPIENELEAAALDAWRNLVHVLTHEIMNSLTPVSSLSQTAQVLLTDLHGRSDRADSASQELLSDMDTALSAIRRRSESLAQFVAHYRSLTNIPAPNRELVNVAGLFERLKALFASGWQRRGGMAEFVVEHANLEILIDPGQLEQAIINLIRNAEEATQEQTAPQLTVLAKLGRGNRLRIEVADNGCGIAEEMVRHIFTPFFTSKSNGSGIGLALVRQLVHNNGGTVRYVKPTAPGAKFVLTF